MQTFYFQVGRIMDSSLTTLCMESRKWISARHEPATFSLNMLVIMSWQFLTPKITMNPLPLRQFMPPKILVFGVCYVTTNCNPRLTIWVCRDGLCHPKFNCLLPSRYIEPMTFSWHYDCQHRDSSWHPKSYCLLRLLRNSEPATFRLMIPIVP